MEEYLIFAAIGGLLVMTLFVNSVSDFYEQKAREKRIKIFQIKRGVDELGDLLERMQECDIPNEVRDLLLNEILVRLQTIQKIDNNFKGIKALIEETQSDTQKAPVEKPTTNSMDDTEFTKKMVTMRRLIKRLGATQWYSSIKPQELKKVSKNMQLLKCEKIFQYYVNKANYENENENYLAAKEQYYYILHALKNSGISGDSRVIELKEQAEFMMEETIKLFSEKRKSLNMRHRPAEEVQEEQDENKESIKENTENKTS